MKLASPLWGTIAGDASRDVSSNATTSVLVAFLVLMAAAALFARWLTSSRDTAHGPLAWFAALGSLAACTSLTLFREGLRATFQPGSVLAWTTSGWSSLADGDLLGSSQFLLNVALFVPAGVAWTWVTGRPLRTLGGLVGLTMLIESVQGVTALGAADITDVAANSLGAALGVGVAAIATTALVRAGRVAGPSSTTPRRRAIVAAVAVVAIAVAGLGLGAAADRRQDHLRDELEMVFADTTLADVAAVLTDEPDEVEPAAEFTDSNQIFDAIAVRPDGFRYAEDLIELRWPARLFGFRRCVFVVWTSAGVTFREVSGATCTEFIG